MKVAVRPFAPALALSLLTILGPAATPGRASGDAAPRGADRPASSAERPDGLAPTAELPEPSTAALAGVGLLILAAAPRLRRMARVEP